MSDEDLFKVVGLKNLANTKKRKGSPFYDISSTCLLKHSCCCGVGFTWNTEDLQHYQQKKASIQGRNTCTFQLAKCRPYDKCTTWTALCYSNLQLPCQVVDLIHNKKLFFIFLATVQRWLFILCQTLWFLQCKTAEQLLLSYKEPNSFDFNRCAQPPHRSQSFCFLCII